MRKLLVSLAIVSVTAGCASLTGSGATEPVAGADTFCRIAKPISWSASDTDDTIRAVKSHNATGITLCGWDDAE